MMVFLKETFEKVEFDKNQQTEKKHAKLPRVKLTSTFFFSFLLSSSEILLSFDLDRDLEPDDLDLLDDRELSLLNDLDLFIFVGLAVGDLTGLAVTCGSSR